MKVMLAHNEESRNVYVHSVNCRVVKGLPFRYSYTGREEVDENESWENIAKKLANGFEVMRWIWIVPDKCLGIQGVRKIKLKYVDGKWEVVE